jgi:hypothetical protein
VFDGKNVWKVSLSVFGDFVIENHRLAWTHFTVSIGNTAAVKAAINSTKSSH